MIRRTIAFGLQLGLLVVAVAPVQAQNSQVTQITESKCELASKDSGLAINMKINKKPQIVTNSENPLVIEALTCTFNIPKGYEPEQTLTKSNFTCFNFVNARTTNSTVVSTKAGKAILTCRING